MRWAGARLLLLLLAGAATACTGVATTASRASSHVRAGAGASTTTVRPTTPSTLPSATTTEPPTTTTAPVALTDPATLTQALYQAAQQLVGRNPTPAEQQQFVQQYQTQQAQDPASVPAPYDAAVAYFENGDQTEVQAYAMAKAAQVLQGVMGGGTALSPRVAEVEQQLQDDEQAVTNTSAQLQAAQQQLSSDTQQCSINSSPLNAVEPSSCQAISSDQEAVQQANDALQNAEYAVGDDQNNLSTLQAEGYAVPNQ
jgi:hypothetical protein